MKITILGTGNMGSALGKRWSEKGHHITYASRNPQNERVQVLTREIGNGTKAVRADEAINGTDVVVLATPWHSAEAALDQIGNIDGKILIDATNPIADGLSGLSIDSDTSAGEMISQWCPGAHIVKAFNTATAKKILSPGNNGDRVSLPICGNHQDAKDIVANLAKDIGFDIYDAGPLKEARYIEPMAMTWVKLTYKEGYGPDMAFKMIKRQVDEEHSN